MDFLDMCGSSAVLRLFYFIKLVVYGLKILLPLICIFILIKRTFSAMLSQDTQKDLKNLVPSTTKMLIAAFAFFFIPTLVEYGINVLADQDVDMAYCFAEATLENIESYEELEMQKLDAEKNNRTEELKELSKKKEELAKKKYEQKAAQDAARNNASGGNTSRVNENAVLASGKSNKYFAPLQNVNYSIGIKDSSGGCDNPVYHDAPVATGAPLYAAMDGVVEYYQYTCNSILYGYGNLAVLRASDGTYINYAHLSKFPTGINSYFTKSCPKKANNEVPCPSSSCDGPMTRTHLGKKEVKRGQVIGYTGDTGNSTGPHLHVEIHEQGSSVCVTDPFQAFGMR